MLGQNATYNVTLAPFSSQKYDEFSPVYYGTGIVFCSNRKTSLLVNRSDSLNRGMFKINYVDTTGRKEWRKPRLFSKDLKTPFNDGPATFNKTRDTVYFSRNLIVEGRLNELTGPKNRLGIFYAVRDGDRWVRIRDMRMNNEWYNVSTPWLSPDGKRLYFASDQPDGYGGSDLYYSQWKKDYWDDPVNLGPVINTPGNESYPFVNNAGELFFSSDGHKGHGGKDIFFSRFADSIWLTPVPLDAPVNSVNDDFGIITDAMMETGYFSSEENNSIDIYQFTTNYPQIFYCKEQRINQSYFRLSDTAAIEMDTLRLQYQWDFGDGKKARGESVEHCFPGPGKYIIKQSITERETGRTVFVKLIYDLEINDIEQPFITCPDFAVKGDQVDLDAHKSYLPGYEILGYTWDLGDSTRINGDSVNHTFNEPGVYNVKLGLKIKNRNTGIVTQSSVAKKITICKDVKELASIKPGTGNTATKPTDIADYDHAFIDVHYSAINDLNKDAVFQVELLSSKNRINPDNENFRQAGQKYIIREVFLKEAGLYSYVVMEEFSLMAVYPALTDVVSMGFKNAMIKTAILTDPAEKELNTLKKVYGLSADAFFEDKSFKLSQGGFAFLDQVANLMKKYSGSRLSIEVYSDESGTDFYNMDLSRKRAQTMAAYLTSRGINSSRLITRGFGRISQATTGDSEANRKINRRVQFHFINE
jgi:outer membrane protein OmpA-like peptidoglycan-associated protein